MAAADTWLDDLFALRAVREDIALIADELDLEHRRVVTHLERRRLARAAGADLQSREAQAFISNGVVAEAVDAQGVTVYLAVEAAGAADIRDAAWAERHAALMTLCTGKPCRGVVASRRTSDQLARMIEAGEIAWHQMKDRREPAD